MSTPITASTRRHIARSIVLASLCIAAAACSASASVGGGVAEAEVEQQAAEQLAATVDVGVTPNIDCPGDLPAKVGAEMTCELNVEGDDQVLPVSIVVTSVEDGVAKFSVEVGQPG